MITLPVQITESTHSVRGKRQGEWEADDWDSLPHDDGSRYDEGRVLRGADLVTFECLPGLSAPVEVLFAGAPDTSL
jgi:hypothetical protein